MMMTGEECHPEEMQRRVPHVSRLRRGRFTFTLSSRYSVIPSAVEGPCVCSALNEQAQVSKSRKRLGAIAEPFASV